MNLFSIANFSRTIWALTLFALIISFQVIDHVPNLSPVFGISIFLPFFFRHNKFFAFFISLGGIFISDLIQGFHYYWVDTYVGVFIALGLGFAASRHLRRASFISSKIITLGGASLLSTLIFYCLSNFHVWVGSGSDSLYPLTFSGLLECYIAAIPFLKNSLLADLGTVYGLFFISELFQKSRVAVREIQISRVEIV